MDQELGSLIMELIAKRASWFVLCVILSWSLLCSSWLHAQTIPHAVVRGRVVDDSTGSSLPQTNVFVANSTIGTAADGEGRFVLRGVPLGTQQIVASIVGYVLETWTLHLTDTIMYEVEFRLRPHEVQMPGVLVEAKDPVEWKKHLQRFVDSFFGTGPNSAQCRLMNPQVLDFQVDEQKNQFTATAREPLEIENRALGYSVTYILRRYVESPQLLQFVGVTHFEESRPMDTLESMRWKESRRKVYYGSRRHFLSALIRKTWKEDGFEVNSIRKTPARMALMWSAGYEVDADTLLKPGRVPYERKLSFEGVLQVIYNHGWRQEFSLIQLDQSAVTIYSNGLVENPLKMVTQGYWSSQRAADLLPTDYEPE
jgi:hypothetical protein